MHSKDFFHLWEAWGTVLLTAPYPHSIPIEKLPGYDGDRKLFEQALWEFEENGFIKVDYFEGVQLTPQAVSFFMANILHERSGNFRQVCKHLLDRLRSQGIDASISGFFEKASDSGRFTGFSKLLNKDEQECF